MTGTSRALRRLGVAGLSAVLMTTGMAAFAATAANAATVNSQATGVDLQPPSDTATVNTCNPFTATVTPSPGAGNNYTVTVTVSQQTTNVTGTLPANSTIGFCGVNTFSPSAGTNPQAAPGSATVGGTNETGTSTQSAAAAPPSGQATTTCTGKTTGVVNTSPGTLTCTAVYTSDSNGVFTFGVISDTAGSMTVTAGVDKNGNGGVDTFEPQDSSAKTWVANTPGTTNAAISCTPTSATNPAGSQHTLTCTVTTSSGTGVTGLGNVKALIQSGPDASNTPVNCTENTTGANSQATGNYGKYSCKWTNSGVTGTDQVVAWIDSNNNNVVDSGEPQQAGISKTWVAAAPANASVVLTCSPNATNTAGTVCQDDPSQDKTATFTATVSNNNTSPASPAANAIVNFTLAENGGPADTTDTETLSASQCVTDASGKCSVVFTDSSPKNGESWTVTASVPRSNGQGPATASATKNFVSPATKDARNITVTPATATQPSGGSQDFLAKVTDRFGNPVPGVCVGFNESGPGHIVGGTGSTGICPFVTTGTYALVCVTGSAGTCGITVVSQSTETGAETVSATIDASNYPGGANGGFVECTAPAGVTFATGTPSSTVTPPGGAAAPGAAAGNCSANGTVTWKTSTPPPPHGRQAVSIHLSCFSRHAHKVTCVAQLSKAIAGVTVIFRDAHGNKVGSDVTGSGGKARLHLRGLRRHSHHKYQAHAKRSSRTFSADSNFARVTVK
jgi:hypothetical protein